MDARLQIGVLGELQVARGGETVPLPPSRKTRALLAYLAVVGRPQRRERLCEMFWEVPDDPRGALRWSLSKIRQIVGGDGESLLDSDRNTVCLRTEGLELDFEHVRQVKLQDVEGLPTEKLEALARLFRGGFLEDLHLPRCPEFEAWRVSHANQTDVLRLRVLRALVERLRDEPERALVHAHALRAIDPEDATLAREADSLAAAAREGARAQPAPDLAAEAKEPDPSPAPVPGPVRTEVGADPDAVAPPRQQDIRFCATRDGVRIAYAVSGQGPALVRAAHWMSHLTYDWESPVWRHWIEALSERYTLIRYDERCNGLSDWDVAELSFESMVTDLETVVDAAQLDRFTLLGISQSCAISVAYAVRHPERVSGLILCGGYVKGWRRRGDSRDIAVREALATLMREGWGQNNPMFRQLFASLYVPRASAEHIASFDELQRRTVSPENAWRLQNMFGEIDVTALLPHVSVPTLVVHSRDDMVAPFEAGREFATGIAGARFVVLDSANHILLPDEPAFRQFLQEVHAFVSETAAPWRPHAGPAEERRQVSVLAAEIVNPLLAFEDMDPEIAMRAVDPLLDLAVEVVERHGGAVVSRGQNDLTAIFGAPAAAEDHACQACRAALALKGDVERRAEGSSRIRVGLDSGEAIVRVRAIPGGSRLEINGSPVRVARQLVQSLRRDLVAATSRGRDAAAGSMEAKELARSDCPSFSRDQPVYEIVCERTAPSRWHLRPNKDLTPLVGRETELQLLHLAAQRARTGSGQLVCMVGDPGLGKSRLAHEFLASPALDGFTVIESGALEFDAQVGYALVKTLLRTLFGIEASDAPAAAAEKVAAGLTGRHAGQESSPALLFALDLPVSDRNWASLSAADRARRVRDAVIKLLAVEARRMPLAVLLEDLHWMDAESGAVLQRLVEGIGGQPVLLIATSRPDHGHDWLSTGSSLQVRLERLDPAASDTFVRTLLGDDPSVRRLAPLIAEGTGGVPLFIEEVVADLVESGRLTGAPGRYAAREEIAELGVPPNIQAVIAARIGNLQERDRWIVQVASVIGRDVPADLLRRVTGCEERSLDDSLRRLQNAGLLIEQQVVPHRIFVFKHALIQRVAYQSILSAGRKRIHSRLVALMEADAGAGDDLVERLGEHAVRAEEWEKAVHYLLRAARKALHRSAHNRALSYLSRGLEILARWPETDERIRMELEYQKTSGVAWMAAKGWGALEVSEAYERAERLCEALGDRSEFFAVLRGRAQYYMISGQPELAQKISTRCREITKESRDEGVAIETHHMFWTNGFFMGDYESAVGHSAHALALYRPDRDHALTFQYSGHDPGVCCRCFSGLSLWQQGRFDLAAQRCRDALELAERLSHPLTSALAFWGLGYLHMFRAEPEVALAWARREIEICDEYMLPLLRSQGLFQAGWAMAALGDAAAGIAQMEQGVASIRATGAEMGLPYFLGLIGEAHRRAGEVSNAMPWIDEALESARKNGARFQFPELLRLKAELLAETRLADRSEIEALLRSAVRSAQRQGAVVSELRAATSLARHLTQTGRRSEARDLLRPHARFISEARDSVDARAAAELL